MARAKLRAVPVDQETGELVAVTREALTGELAFLRDVVKGHEHTIRSWEHKYHELMRDKDAEARAHELWPAVVELFKYWQELTGHTRTGWTPERFWCAAAYVKGWGVGNIAAAIAGIAHEPFAKEQPGCAVKVSKYDDWETVFKNNGAVRRYIGKRPAGWVLPERFKALAEEWPSGKLQP